MKLAVTTLGCPKWNLETLLTNAMDYGYDGIDFRGLNGHLDITTLPAFTTDLQKSARRINDSGLTVFGISSSLCICDTTRHQKTIDEAQRTIPIALALGAKNVRVMGYGDIENKTRPELARIAAATMSEVLALPDAKKLSWNFETHDHWIKCSDTKLILDAIPSDNFGAVWDTAGQMLKNETPEQAYAALAPRVRYVHMKDAKYEPQNPKAIKGEFGVGTGWHYVPPGTGDLPLARCLKVLQQNGYEKVAGGWILFEYEQHWHPELPDPEIAFPQFIQWIKPLL